MVGNEQVLPVGEDSSFPFFTYNCLKFPDCGWIAINHVPESVVSRDVHDVTVEVEYYWINPGRDGWILLRSNGPSREEQDVWSDINTHKEFFRANEWATWTVRLTNTWFGTRADGTDLFFLFGADPDDVCYIRAVKVYQTDTPENTAVFDVTSLKSGAQLALNTQFHDRSFFAFDLHAPKAEGIGHWRSGVEVIFGKTDGQITIDGEVMPYHENDILFVNPDQIRTADAAITGSCYYLMFDLAMLESRFRNSVITDIRLKKKQFCNLVPTGHPAHETLQQFCRELVAVYSSDSVYKEMKIQSLLLALLYECCEQGLIVDAPPAGNPRKMDYIRNALTYMENHLAGPVAVGDVAAYVHLSEAYFSRHFKTCIGSTPLEHLNNMRVEKAAELLISGSSVTEAAMEVGVPNVGHFIRLFKKRYGTTPYQWQKKLTGRGREE